MVWDAHIPALLTLLDYRVLEHLLVNCRGNFNKRMEFGRIKSDGSEEPKEILSKTF